MLTTPVLDVFESFKELEKGPSRVVRSDGPAGERLYGVLSLARLGAGSLTAEDRSLVETISAQTALALANAEEYTAAEDTIAALSAIEALEGPRFRESWSRIGGPPTTASRLSGGRYAMPT